MKNIFSIDVESWVHFYYDALKEKCPLTSLERKELDGGYVRNTIFQLLEMLACRKQRATFFIVAEIYDWYPEAIVSIAAAGHEIAYHTFQHTVISSADLLRKELELSKNFLERFHPIGFRAPQIVITRDAFPYLKEHGFVYSSSTYDNRERTVVGGVDEIPVSMVLWRKQSSAKVMQGDALPKKLTFRLLSCAWPVGSGLSLIVGGRLTGKIISNVNQKEQRPVVLFIHPWQLFDHPKIRGIKFLWQVLKHNPPCLPYVKNVSRACIYLLDNFYFNSFRDYYYG